MTFRYIFVYCVFTSYLVAGQSPIYGLQGKAVELKTDIKTQPDDILWKRYGNKVVEFNGQEEKQYDPFKNRVTLDWHYADLKIEHLTIEDSGLYELDVFTSQILDSKSYTLVVIDAVPKPTVTCEMNKDSSSDETGKSATLTCFAPSQSSIIFEWSSNGRMQPGQTLVISLGDEHDSEEHTCNVSNPLTSNSTVFTTKMCYPDKESSTTLTVILPILCIIIVLLISALLLFYFLWRQGRLCTAGVHDVEKHTSHDDGVSGGVERPLLNRTDTIPSRQKLGHLNLMNQEEANVILQKGHTKEEEEDKLMDDKDVSPERENEFYYENNGSKIPSPPRVALKPNRSSNYCGNSQEPADEHECTDTTEKKNTEDENSDSKMPSCPPVAPKRNHTFKKPGPAGEDKYEEPTEKKDSEGDSSNGTLPDEKSDSTMPSRPPVAAKRNCASFLTVRNPGPAAEIKWEEPTERKDSAGDSSNGTLPDENYDSKMPSRPPVAAKRNHTFKKPGPAGEDKYEEPTEKKDSEGDSSLPDKDNGSKISSPPPVPLKPHCASTDTGNSQEPAHEDECTDTTEKKNTEGDGLDSEKKDDPLPAPKRICASFHAVKNPGPAGEDKCEEPTEKKDSEDDSSNGTLPGPDVMSGEGSVRRQIKKIERQHVATVFGDRPALDLSRNNQEPAEEEKREEDKGKVDSDRDDDGLTGKDKDSRSSSPIQVSAAPPSDCGLIANDQPGDEDEQKASKPSSESEKVDDALPGKDLGRKNSIRPPVAPKPHQALVPSASNRGSTGEDALRGATEKQDSERDSSNALPGSDKKNPTPPPQPHSTSTQNTPKKSDADHHKDPSSDKVADVEPENSVGRG